MAYLQFNKEELVNLEYSLKREFLSTNHAGGYLNTTIVCCNTRKYHGLLVLPIANFNFEKFVLLSSLDETLIQHDKSFNLGIHRYGDIYEPRGHKYIRDFEIDKCVSIVYRVGGIVLKKEMMLTHNEEQYYARYTLMEANSPTTLRLKPFLAFRHIHVLSKANLDANKGSREINKGQSFRMYEGFPELNLQLNVKNEYVSCPDWYYNIEYKEERRRAYESSEDLFVPGYFEMPIKKGESIIFSASTKEQNPQKLAEKFEKYLEQRSSRDSFESCLKIAAKQFITQTGDDLNIYAGYPWLDRNIRETLLAAPGLTLYAAGDQKRFTAIIDTVIKKEKGLLTGESNQPDVPLWLFWALQHYAAFINSESKVWKEYGALLKEILISFKNGARSSVKFHDNGLLWAEKRNTALTWMDAVVDGVPVTERAGYQVELNSLWYNAIMFAISMSKKSKDPGFVKEWEPVAKSIEKNFTKAFWIDSKEYLADYVGPEGQNKYVRPNQLFTCAFEYSPIDDEHKAKVLQKIKQELLTSRGIRTLSPQNSHYKAEYDGDENARSLAYHQGTARPWLLSFYIESNFKLHGRAFLNRAEELLAAFEEDIQIHCIGSISEVYDGDPPHQPHGCTSYSISVAALMRAMRIIENFKKSDL